ncbi:MAG: class I SAM-dependent methyltransferase [Proteobacteria bacterium]|nr:class I SAM-dependent methyltransferase [Pseudomonadota bacterium]
MLKLVFENFKILYLMCFLHGCGYVSAGWYTHEQAINKYDELNLKIPMPENDGRTQTLNKKGAATAKFDYATKKFLEYAKGKNVLEIGGAYGDVMLAALKQSKDTQYTLSDLDERHLFIAAKKLSIVIDEKKLKEESLNRVKFIQADITQANDISEIGTYDAIFVGRVLHFLNPEQLQATVRHLFLLLKPGGRIFAVAVTPYVKRYERFIPEYERRVHAGEKNPGFITSLTDYLNADVTTPAQSQNIASDPFFFLDDEVMRKLFESNDFRVIESKMMPLSYSSASWALDGRENVILIAEKQ